MPDTAPAVQPTLHSAAPDAPPRAARPGPARRTIGREALAVAIVVLVVLLLRSVTSGLLVGAFNDDGVYIALGKAIAEGEGYRSIHLVGDPVHTKYPPGLPAMLALAWLLTGSLAAVHAVGIAGSAAATAAAAGLLWWMARARLGLHPALVAGFVIGPFLLDASTQYLTLVISEPWFLLGWAAALVLDDRLRRVAPDGSRLAPAIVLGLTLAAATLVRAQFVIVAAAVLAPLLAARALRRAAVVAATACVVPLGLWRIWHGVMVSRGPVATQSDESYAAFLAIGGAAETSRRFLSSSLQNVAEYGAILRDYLSGLPWLGGTMLAAGALLAIAGARRLVRGHPALVLGVLLNALVVVAWPFSQDRLVLVMLPVAGLLAAEGARACLARSGRRLRPIVMIALAAGAAVVVGRQEMLRRGGDAAAAGEAPAAVFSPRVFLAQMSRYEYAVSRWVITHAAPTDRVILSTPASLYLYTGRKTVSSEPIDGRLASSVHDVPGRYLASRILADGVTLVIHEREHGGSTRELAAVLAACPGVLRFRGEFARGALPRFYGVQRGDDGDDCLRALAGGEPPAAPDRRVATGR